MYSQYPYMSAVAWPFLDAPADFLTIDQDIATLPPATSISGVLSLPYTYQFNPYEPDSVVQVFATGNLVEHWQGYLWSWNPFTPAESYAQMVDLVNSWVASSEEIGTWMPTNFAQFGAKTCRRMRYDNYGSNFTYNYYSATNQWGQLQYWCWYTWDVSYQICQILKTSLQAIIVPHPSLVPLLLGAALIFFPLLFCDSVIGGAINSSASRRVQNKS